MIRGEKEAHRISLQSYYHPIWASEMLDVGLTKPCAFHPVRTLLPSVIEATLGEQSTLNDPPLGLQRCIPFSGGESLLAGSPSHCGMGIQPMPGVTAMR